MSLETPQFLNFALPELFFCIFRLELISALLSLPSK